MIDPDHALRVAAIAHARVLAHHYRDLVPLPALRDGFSYRGGRVSFGSFFNGIHRGREQSGPAALTLTTAAPRPGRARPYDDDVDPDGAFSYAYREPAAATATARRQADADNRSLTAAYEMQVPLIWFVGQAPGMYQPVAPVFIRSNDPVARRVTLEVGLPVADMTPAGATSDEDVRRYAIGDARRRLHQTRFRLEVMHAYRSRCTICRLREATLVEAAHIIGDSDPRGLPIVVNGLALCTIHHAAYDRNLIGIDPGGVVHLSERLLSESDGPMLSEGLQRFHLQPIELPRRVEQRPDPARLETRFETFRREAA